MKEQCNLDILQEIMGLQSDEKIVVKFMWLTTLMFPLSKIFGLLSWNLIKRFLMKWRKGFYQKIQFLSRKCGGLLIFRLFRFLSIFRDENQWFTSNWKYKYTMLLQVQ